MQTSRHWARPHVCRSSTYGNGTPHLHRDNGFRIRTCWRYVNSLLVTHRGATLRAAEALEQAQWQDEHRDDQHDNYDCGATATTILVCVRANRLEARARGILELLASVCTNLPSHQPCATSQLDSQEIDSTTDSNNPCHVTVVIARIMPSHTSQRKHTLRSMDQRPGFQEVILHRLP